MAIDERKIKELESLSDSELERLLVININCLNAILNAPDMECYNDWRSDHLLVASSRDDLCVCLLQTLNGIDCLKHVLNNVSNRERVEVPRSPVTIQYHLNSGITDVRLQYGHCYHNKNSNQTVFQALVDVYNQVVSDGKKAPLELCEALINNKPVSC
jgi:hypothetical protein